MRRLDAALGSLPIYLGREGERLLAIDFKKVKLSEMSGQDEVVNPARQPLYSELWQADGHKIRRFAPADFIGRYRDNFFDYAIADEVHELKGGDTAQGNALRTLSLGGHTQTIVVHLGSLEAERG